MTSSTPVTSTSSVLRTDAPASTTRWQHSKGTIYTVLLVSNGAGERPDEYPETVVYQDDNGKVWSRPLSRWHGSMTEVPKAAKPGELAGMPEVALTEHLAKWGPGMQHAADHYKTCGHCGGFEALVGMKWRLYVTQQALRAQLQGAQDVQDDLVKRAQAPVGNDKLPAFDSTMSREEVAHQFRRLVERVRSQPAKEASLVVFEWLSALWTAVSVLENRAASVAERQAAANGLRVRLENEVASPDGRKPAAAQLRSPEVGTDSPWFPLPLDEVAKAEGNGYDVRYLFDHAEGAPVVAVLRVEDGISSHQLVNNALYLQDGAYALHALSVSPATADALQKPAAPATADNFA